MNSETTKPAKDPCAATADFIAGRLAHRRGEGIGDIGDDPDVGRGWAFENGARRLGPGEISPDAEVNIRAAMSHCGTPMAFGDGRYCGVTGRPASQQHTAAHHDQPYGLEGVWTSDPIQVARG